MNGVPVNFANMNLQRLKAYRKGILAKVACYEHCDCGSAGCDHLQEVNKNNPNYIFLKSERDRVNTELAARQTKERVVQKQKQRANVPRV